MDISNVANKILSDAEKEKEEILKEAETKAKEIIAKAKKEKKSIIDEAEAKAKLRYTEVFEMEKLKIQSMYNQKILEMKLAYIDEIINKIKEKLSKTSKKDFEQFISKSFDEIDIKEGEFIIGSKEKNIDNKKIISIAKKYGIKMKESKEKKDFEYGIKIIKGKAQYNISPISQFEENINKYRMEISSILFPKED